MRQHFKISRASEYFDPSELSKRTGRSRENWTYALLKELMDNALDITDSVENPEIEISVSDNMFSVWDNGPGMSSDLIKSILDFDSRVSDKFAYQGPTRGQQGNAFKTFLGIACNMGGYVQIESQGLQHTIRCKTNPAGDVDVDHRGDDFPCTGTKIIIHGQHKTDLEVTVTNYHLVNPFVQIRYFSTHESTSIEGAKPLILYKLGSLDKINVTDPTSPHWYSLENFQALAYLSDKKGLPMGQFLGSFQGLTTSKKKKTVAAGLDLKTIASDRDQCSKLLARMKAETRMIKPNKLGLIGEKTWSNILQPKISWYKKACGVHDGKPWAFEIMVAECGWSGSFTAVNHSITFESFINEYGGLDDGWLHASNFEEAAYYAGATDTLVVAHFIGISPEFVSLGKDKIIFPDEIKQAMARQARLALNELHEEQKKSDRDDAKVERDRINRNRPEKEMSLTDAVALVAEAAVVKATSNYTITASARDVYYAARKMVQAYTSAELKGGTFAREIEKYWQSIGGRSEWVHYDARGFLYEPHTGREIALGTKGVSNYHLPSWRYDKVLYVEKKGVAVSIIEMGLPEKYDMAVVGSAGFSTVAAREMLRQAQDHGCTIFVFRDCDPAGYEIVRTLSEPTSTMPHNDITVVDLGLDVATCIELGLETETFTQKGSLPSKQDFTEQELEFFSGTEGWYTDKKGKHKKCWTGCKRVEINEMTALDRVEYLDRKIGEYLGGLEKVIPPEKVQREKAKEKFRGELDQRVDDYFTAMIDDIKEKVQKKFPLPGDHELNVERHLEKNNHDAWDDAISANIAEFVAESDGDIKELIKSFDE